MVWQLYFFGGSGNSTQIILRYLTELLTIKKEVLPFGEDLGGAHGKHL